MSVPQFVLPPLPGERRRQQIIAVPQNSGLYTDQGFAFPQNGQVPHPQLPIVAPVPYNGNPNQNARMDDLSYQHLKNMEARIYALEMQTGASQQKPAKAIGPPDEPGDWVGISSNAYGAFIHQAFHKEVIGREGALVQYGPMVCASFLVQACIAYELWQELPKQRDGDLICPLHSNLQLAAMSVFLLVTFENIPKMYNALIITCFCTHFRDKGTKKEQEVTRLRIYRRSCMFLFAVLSEFVAWFAVLSVGIIWLLSASSHESIIRTTVAITFVNNVDEFVYSGCVTAERKDEHAKYEYLVGYKGSGSQSVNTKRLLEKAFDIYYTHLHLFLISAIACGIVYGVRVADVGCKPY